MALTFRKANVDFDPCARFGIGFMSAFMLGDLVKIETRRDNGPTEGHGEPLIVDIQGIGGIVVMRQGASDQPIGTTVTITLRENPTFIDSWNDPVQLSNIASGYILASDFPIECECTIPGIESSLEIPTTIAPVNTNLEKNDIENILVLDQDFSDIDHRLSGSIKHGFLCDNDTKLPTLENKEGAWIKKSRNIEYVPKNDSNGLAESYFDDISQTCLDGILVCGMPGRDNSNYRLGHHRKKSG